MKISSLYFEGTIAELKAKKHESIHDYEAWLFGEAESIQQAVNLLKTTESSAHLIQIVQDALDRVVFILVYGHDPRLM